ncbi:hypothetical protein Y032_0776g2267 [Ancylostoma ceylanicum]|uniref:Uncharacterized protein n=1 Tax=Ancylostoma ceylanicum TaxID=53326 RepID=A0A016WF58_9BILA|nr:hypothetical protein Y032_0776g2267 [Ancylostoma ceylanicum]
MVRVQQEIKQRAAAIPNIAVSNLVEERARFINEYCRHLAELHTRINEVDHPAEIAEDEHKAVAKTEPYEEDEAVSRISLREKAYYSSVATGKGRNSAHWNGENTDESTRTDDESLRAVKEEQCSQTEPIAMTSAKKRGKVIKTSQSSGAKVPKRQVRKAAGSDEGSTTEPSTQSTKKGSRKRTRKLKKKQSADDVADRVGERFSDEFLKMDAENFDDDCRLSVKPKLDADFEESLRTLENLVRGPDTSRLAALGILE